MKHVSLLYIWWKSSTLHNSGLWQIQFVVIKCVIMRHDDGIIATSSIMSMDLTVTGKQWT